MILPAIGYLGVKRESARLIWLFHLGNVQFAIFHAVVACIMLSLVVEIESMSAEAICQHYRPMIVEAPGASPAQAQADQAAAMDIYQACVKEVTAKKEHIPWKLFWWG